MPHIPKQRIKDFIDDKLRGFQDILEGRVTHIRHRFDEETCQHMLWSYCTEIFDFWRLGLITYEEFGQYMYRFGEIVEGKPELEKLVTNVVQMAAGNDPF